GADQLAQLAEIDLRDQHLLVRADDFAGVAGKRVQVVQVSVRDHAALAAHAADAGRDGPEGAAPGEDQQVGSVGVVNLQFRDVGGDSGDLLRAQACHQVVVFRVVGDIAGQVLLLEPADPV